MIAPFPPGGPSDALARILSGPLEAALGQPIVIENVGGAGGTLGVGRAARAAPDGYTLLVGQWSTQVVNPATYNLSYDIVNDFAPIALLANTPQIIIARKDFPAKDVPDLIGWLKAHPGQANAATVGAAGGAQVAGMYFAQVTGKNKIRLRAISGGAPAMQDLMAGRGRHHVRSSRKCNHAGSRRHHQGLRGHATGASMATSAPDIPTIDESGVARVGMFRIGMRCGRRRERRRMLLPRSTLRRSAALADPAVQQSLRGATRPGRLARAISRRPEALAAFYKAEIANWWPTRPGPLKAE